MDEFTLPPPSKANALTFWDSASKTDYAAVKQAMDNLDLGKYVPGRRGDLACLKEAIKDDEKDKHVVVQLSDKDGFAVVVGTAASAVVGSTWGQTKRILKITGTMPCTITCDPPDLMGYVVQNFFEAWGQMTSTQLGEMLVSICTGLGGQGMRKVGGFYWIPSYSLPKWEEVARAFKELGCGKLYLVRHQLDADSIEAVLDAVVREAKSQLNAISKEVGAGTLGARALESRAEMALVVRDKLRRYEGLMGVSLASIIKSAEDVETTAALALIEARADDDIAQINQPVSS